MRRLMITIVAAGVLAGPFAGSALAQDPPLNEPVRDALCSIVKKLGWVYVEPCYRD